MCFKQESRSSVRSSLTSSESRLAAMNLERELPDGVPAASGGRLVFIWELG